MSEKIKQKCQKCLFNHREIEKSLQIKEREIIKSLQAKEIVNQLYKTNLNLKNEEIAKLKQQLAEKEKNFEWLHQKLAKYVENNQDKISFCIEQLKKVREWIGKEVDVEYTRYIQIVDYIDNQIKQLKEGK